MLISCSPDEAAISRAIDFNSDWKFSLDEEEGAWQQNYNDEDWRTLNLPHDWVIENTPDSTFEYWQATGRIPGKGIGWYRKSFLTNIEIDEVCYVLFDGVYNNATVWINGHELGFHPYGYSPFYYNLTPYLNHNGKENVLAVKVDHTRYADSRWYTGAGIYRNVKLITTNKIHIPVWGMFVTTLEVSTDLAKVNILIEVNNKYSEPKTVDLLTTIFGPNGSKVVSSQKVITIGTTSESVVKLDVKNPLLWDTENPNLYKAVTSVRVDGEIVDTYEQKFGIRSIRFDANKGFFLNGKNRRIKGVCLHHDGGLVGAAVPKGVWKRRLEILKAGGCNAIRSAHNPASDEFLDLCDEMGFLVQDEFFDEWDNPKDKRFNMNQQSIHEETQGYGEHFQKWAQADIESTMMSHRNHPSIIQWSIGNEIEWTYPRNQDATGFFNNMNWEGNYFWTKPPYSPQRIKQMLETLPKGKYDIGETAKKLADWTRQYDTTRYITANCILPSVSHLNGYVDALDMVGYSYRRVLYDYSHQNYPEVPIMGMENVPQYHEWKAVKENPHIAGTFLWTGIEYMGEVRAKWPAKSNGSGMLDLAGFPRPSYHMYKSLWTDEPQVYMTTNRYDQIKYWGNRLYKVNENLQVEEFKPDAWQQIVWGWQTVNEHWNYQKGDTIIVEVISNCPQVELFLNDRSLGEKNKADFEDNILKWALVYQKGELKAVGKKNGTEVLFSYRTSGEATSIDAKIDKSELLVNNYDVAHVEVQLLDANGNPTHDDRLITFEVDEKLRTLGVDNGSQFNVQDFQSNKIKTDKGRALLIVKTMDQSGDAVIVIKSDGLRNRNITIQLVADPNSN